MFTGTFKYVLRYMILQFKDFFFLKHGADLPTDKDKGGDCQCHLHLSVQNCHYLFKMLWQFQKNTKGFGYSCSNTMFWTLL